jgi:hypothetical protein
MPIGATEEPVFLEPPTNVAPFTPDSDGAPRRRRVPWRRIGRAVAPAAIFLGVRLVGLAVLAVLATNQHVQLGDELSSWDGQWFLGIAQGGGYDGVPAGLADAYGKRSAETPLAFFPGYPATVTVVRFLTGLPLVEAGLLAATVAGVVAAHGVARLGELVPGGSRRVGLVLVTLFSATPMAVVFSMTYSEALFCAVAAWALVALLRRQWLLAGLLTAVTGLVRPTATGLVVAVGGAALLAALARRDGWRPWVGGLLTPLGLLGYLGWVGTRTGSVTGWFDLQERGWGSHFDGGAATLSFAREILASGRSVLEVATIGALLGGLVLLVVGVRMGLPWPLLAYAAVVLVMDVGSNGLMNSKIRLLLPAFTLLLPMALGLARRRPGTTTSVLVAAVVASAWFGAYALIGWPYAI